MVIIQQYNHVWVLVTEACPGSGGDSHPAFISFRPALFGVYASLTV